MAFSLSICHTSTPPQQAVRVLVPRAFSSLIVFCFCVSLFFSERENKKKRSFAFFLWRSLARLLWKIQTAVLSYVRQYQWYVTAVHTSKQLFLQQQNSCVYSLLCKTGGRPPHAPTKVILMQKFSNACRSYRYDTCMYNTTGVCCVAL